ncbi:hypothetical protein NECID01_0177 [Nematocida sp. AWRm77]|nr:hypothetical protein NECID01_0177 [Nematocida sp. AWRm77]
MDPAWGMYFQEHMSYEDKISSNILLYDVNVIAAQTEDTFKQFYDSSDALVSSLRKAQETMCISVGGEKFMYIGEVPIEGRADIVIKLYQKVKKDPKEEGVICFTVQISECYLWMGQFQNIHRDESLKKISSSVAKFVSDLNANAEE